MAAMTAAGGGTVGGMHWRRKVCTRSAKVMSGSGSGGAGGAAGARPPPPRLTTATKALFEKVSSPKTSREQSSSAAAAEELQGLAFSSNPQDLDPRQAAALMGHAGDARVIAKLRKVFNSPEGCVIGAFARVEDACGFRNSDGDGDLNGGGGGGGGGVSAATLMASMFDMLAGEVGGGCVKARVQCDP